MIIIRLKQQSKLYIKIPMRINILLFLKNLVLTRRCLGNIILNEIDRSAESVPRTSISGSPLKGKYLTKAQSLKINQPSLLTRFF